VYAAWLAAALVLQLVGYADTRAPRDLYTILAEVAVAALALAVWRFRTPLREAMTRARITGVGRFVLAGLIAAYLSEVFFYLAIASTISLPAFMLRTLVWYVGWFTAWWWLSRRYGFTASHIFFLGGLNGFLVEGLILRPVPLSALGLFLYPLVASLYGAMLLIPHRLDSEVATLALHQVTGARRFGLSLLPLLAFVPGFVWFVLVQIVFGIG